MQALSPWDCECSSAGSFACLSAAVLGCLILWGFLRCCWVSESYIINAGQPLADWLSPHWFFVRLWQGRSWVWGVRLQAAGTGRGSRHPHSNPKSLHVWDIPPFASLPPHPSYFGTMMAKAPRDPLVLALRSPSPPDHAHPGSGGSPCPNCQDSLVRNKQKDFSGHRCGSGYYGQFSTSHWMAKGLARNPYQKWHQRGRALSKPSEDDHTTNAT